MKRVYILLGGFVGPDGWATSAGMFALSSMLSKLPNVAVKTYTWDRYKDAAADMPTHDPNIVIGYSGGGSRATWLNRDYPHQHIDLMVLYDPSPRWQMVPINSSVKDAITYENSAPMFFGLGGGVLQGTHITRVPIAMNHMLVQGNMDLHRRTVDAVRIL